MDNRKALNEFIEKVNNGEKSFVVILNNDSSVHFMSCKHGAAEYYFYCKQYEVSKFRNLDNKYEIAAVVSNGKIYIVDWYVFGIYSFEVAKEKDSFPECIVNFDWFVRDINNYLINDVYPEYYAGFNATKTDNENLQEENMKKVARTVLFAKKEINYDVTGINGVSRDDTVEMLCCNSDFRSVCLAILEEQKDHINYLKIREELIRSLIDSGKAAADWEIEMANAINETGAKTVMVEFEFNGKTESEKFECEKLIHILIDNDYFSDYNFPTSNAGKSVLKKLGASAYYYSPETNLYAKNIKSISFRGKKIYERKD